MGALAGLPGIELLCKTQNARILAHRVVQSSKRDTQVKVSPVPSDNTSRATALPTTLDKRHKFFVTRKLCSRLAT